MLIGPHATAASERAAFADLIQADPRGYMAQPTVYLSRIPTVIGDVPLKAVMLICDPLPSIRGMKSTSILVV